MRIDFPASWSEIVNDFISACLSLQSLNFPTIQILAGQRAQACCPHKSQPPAFPRPDVLKGNVLRVPSTLFVRRHCVFVFSVLSQNTLEVKTFHQKHPPPGYLRNPILSKVLVIVFCERAVFSGLSTAQAFQNSFGQRLPLQQWAYFSTFFVCGTLLFFIHVLVLKNFSSSFNLTCPLLHKTVSRASNQSALYLEFCDLFS